MKLLLINPPNLEEDKILSTQIYSIGILTLYSVAKTNGYDVDLVNIQSVEDLRSLNLCSYSLVGIPCYTRQRYSVFKTIDFIKNESPLTKVVVGGPHVLGIEAKILEFYKNCDFVISREGEVPLTCLLECIKLRVEDFSSVPNLTWRNNNSIITNNISFNKNFEEIPFPYYHQEYFEDYAHNARGGIYFKSAKKICGMSFSRGCNNSCIFCANQAIFGKQRFFSLSYVKQLIQQVYKKQNVSTFQFVDDDFCGDRQRVYELCDWIISEKFNIQWRCSTRANNIDAAIVKKMIAAGCKMISIGMESGSQKVLNSIDKNCQVTEVINNLQSINKLNIEIRLSLTFGYDVEDNEAYEDTINLINQVKPNAVAFFFLKVYPGTPLYKIALKTGYITDDFWFENEKLVPFFEMYMKYADFEEVKRNILSKIKAEIPSGYNEKRDDSEYYLNWK